MLATASIAVTQRDPGRRPNAKNNDSTTPTIATTPVAARKTSHLGWRAALFFIERFCVRAHPRRRGAQKIGRGRRRNGMKRVWALAVHTIAAAAGASAQMVSRDGIQANIVRPPTVPATVERVASLKVAPGFRVQVFADGLGKARMLAVGPKGDVYLTRREPGDLWRLRDADGDGRAEVKEKIVELPALHGIAFHGGRAYLATPHEIFRGDVKTDGTFGPLEMIVHDLPDAGQHNSPDGSSRAPTG